jgi:hypothetical protein
MFSATAGRMPFRMANSLYRPLSVPSALAPLSPLM